MPSMYQHLKEINKIRREERIKRMELYCLLNQSRFYSSYFALMIVLIHMCIFDIKHPAQYVLICSTLLLTSITGYWWYDCEQNYAETVKNTNN